jgi:hypothetical protein
MFVPACEAGSTTLAWTQLLILSDVYDRSGLLIAREMVMGHRDS